MPKQTNTDAPVKKLLRFLRRFAEGAGEADAPFSTQARPTRSARAEVLQQGATQRDATLRAWASRVLADALPQPLDEPGTAGPAHTPTPALPPPERRQPPTPHGPAAFAERPYASYAPPAHGQPRRAAERVSVEEVARQVTDHLDLECKRRTSLSLTEALQDVRDRLRQDGRA